ncbi:MAG: hypothetical protein K6C08_06335 [Oscillospiraceae bacterium]|nr:hypothetical protein [Oscillospiraceae bacterium]
MNRSNNRRFQRTERLLQDRVLELVEADPDTGLTVDAICGDLPINRSSFYIHHRNIQSILDAILTRLFDEHIEQLHMREGILLQDAPVSSALLLSARFIQEHKGFFRYCSAFSENTELGNQYAQRYYALLSPSFQAGLGLTELQLSVLGEFLKAGAAAVTERWLKNSDDDSLDEITGFFMSVSEALEKQIRD